MKESEKKAISKYQAKFDDIKLRVPKGKREKYKNYASSQNKSLNSLIIELLDKQIEKE